MTKQQIVKKVLAELKAKGLLNEKAIKKHIKEAGYGYNDLPRKSVKDISYNIYSKLSDLSKSNPILGLYHFDFDSLTDSQIKVSSYISDNFWKKEDPNLYKKYIAAFNENEEEGRKSTQYAVSVIEIKFMKMIYKKYWGEYVTLFNAQNFEITIKGEGKGFKSSIDSEGDTKGLTFSASMTTSESEKKSNADYEINNKNTKSTFIQKFVDDIKKIAAKYTKVTQVTNDDDSIILTTTGIKSSDFLKLKKDLNKTIHLNGNDIIIEL